MSAIAVFLLTASGCSRSEKVAASPPEKRPIVAVAKVAVADLEKKEVIAAEFRPFQLIDVHSKVAGYLKKIYVDVGDRVHEGQTLALLEVPELADEMTHAQAAKNRNMAEVDRAKMDLARAQAQYDASRLTYDRLLAVSKSRPNLIAQQEIDDAEARSRSAQASVSAAKAAVAASQQGVDVSQSDVEKVRTMTGYTKITAPFAGVVTKRYADTGAMIPAGTATTSNGLALVQLSQNNLLRLVLPVPEAIAAGVRTGQAVSVRVDALKRNFVGKVSRTADTVATATRTMEVQIDVPNPGLVLIPGMYAEATISVEKRPGVLVVPLAAVTASGKTATVFVVGNDGKIQSRRVQLGLETPDRVEIVSGLSFGEMVVVGNRSSLTAGQSVEPKLMGSAKGAE